MPLPKHVRQAQAQVTQQQAVISQAQKSLRPAPNVLMLITIRSGEATGEQRERAIQLLNRVGLGDQLRTAPR